MERVSASKADSTVTDQGGGGLMPLQDPTKQRNVDEAGRVAAQPIVEIRVVGSASSRQKRTR